MKEINARIKQLSAASEALLRTLSRQDKAQFRERFMPSLAAFEKQNNQPKLSADVIRARYDRTIAWYEKARETILTDGRQLKIT